jgi:molecular chaperone GrpE
MPVCIPRKSDVLCGGNFMGQDHKEKQEEDELDVALQILDEEKKRSEEYLTRLKYMQADFENLKKRFDRELDETKKYCNERLIVELLEVVDELEMAIKLGSSSCSAKELVQGVKMTLAKLNKLLSNEGVCPIESVGKTFDPLKHHAVAKIEKDDVDDCIVVEEVRRGYAMKDKVIRPSIVKVAVKTSSKSQQEMNENE